MRSNLNLESNLNTLAAFVLPKRTPDDFIVARTGALWIQGVPHHLCALPAVVSFVISILS